MELICEECNNSTNLDSIDFEVIEKGEDIEDGNWYMDADFEKNTGQDFPIEIKKFELYCPEHC